MRRSREQKDADWEASVKMALIARDLMVGNPRLTERGYGEEALGRNALVGGFQGQRQWTDHFPNGDFLEAILTSSFDWNGIREPFMVATENDALNGVSMLFGHLLSGTAQIFADVRTHWSVDAVARVTGHTLRGRAAGGLPPPHQLGSRRARRDGGGGGRARHEALLGHHTKRGGKVLTGHHLAPRHDRILPRRRLVHALPHAGRDARDHVPPELSQRFRPRPATRRGLHGRATRRRSRRARRAHQPHLADDLVCAQLDRQRPLPGRLQRDGRTGARTTGPSLTATSAATSSPWPRCCGFRSTCTTCPRRGCSGRTPGAPLGRAGSRAPTSGPARPLGRSTDGTGRTILGL